MIDLGALWMAVDPPGDRPRTVRLNGAPSAAARRGWEAIAGAIGAVAAPPAVVLVDTLRGLSASIGDAGAAETITALVAPGRTVVLVLDDLAEAERFGALALRHGTVVSVDGQAIRGVHPVAELLGGPAVPPAPEAVPGPPAPGPLAPGPVPGPPPPRRAWAEAAAELAKPVPTAPNVREPNASGVPEQRESDDAPAERRRRWWRRAEPTPAREAEVPAGPPEPRAVDSDPAVGVDVTVADTTGSLVSRPLAPDGYYLVRIAMRAAPTPSTVFPDDARGATSDEIGAWVQVSVVAETMAVPTGPHAMFVPRHGAAWTCPCTPDGPHTCLPQERSERLDLPFVAPRRPDRYRVHVAVRHRTTVIHQTRLELPVAGPGSALTDPAGPSAIVTYQAPRG